MQYKIGDKVLFRDKECQIWGFSKDLGAVVLSGDFNGHDGIHPNYSYDENGQKIDILIKDMKDKWFVGTKEVKPMKSQFKFLL